MTNVVRVVIASFRFLICLLRYRLYLHVPTGSNTVPTVPTYRTTDSLDSLDSCTQSLLLRASCFDLLAAPPNPNPNPNPKQYKYLR